MKPYKCPAGRMTIGWGFNYQDNGIPAGLPTALCTELFEKGFTANLAEYLVRREAEKAVGSASQFKFFEKLSINRQVVVADMIYQMGLGGFQNFRKAIDALTKSNFNEASAQMMDSKWFKQSGRRSRSNVDQMIQDKWIMYEK